MSSDLLSEFGAIEYELKDALNYARGHLILGDREAALNSIAIAQEAMLRIEDLVETGNEVTK